MKDGKKYGELLLKLFQKLKKENKDIQLDNYHEPVHAIVFACISENATLQNAREIEKDIYAHFVDVNDLRVCRKEEMLEIIGDRIEKENAKHAVQKLNQTLNAVFNKYDKISLEELKTLGKRDARKEIEQIEGINPYVTSYVLLTSLEAHAVPLNDRMIEYLRERKLVHPEAQPDDIYGFIERVVPAKDATDFYLLLRNDSEAQEPIVQLKAQAKTKRKNTKKKTAKKKTTQKKTTPKKTVKKKTPAKKTVKKKKTKKKNTKKRA